MSQINLVRDRVARSFRSLHEDEAGLATIEMVLILCAAAVVLALAFKLLWGSDNKGSIAAHITTTISNFTSLFTFTK